MPLTVPEPRYFSIPSAVVGGAARRKAALNCRPRARSLTQVPLAWTNSPALIAAAAPTTVARSRWPRALTRSTQKPVSGLWNVTRSTSPASASRSGEEGGGVAPRPAPPPAWSTAFSPGWAREVRIGMPGRDGVGSIAKCESPTFAGVCTSEAPLGPDLPSPRPRRTPHPLPPRRGPPARRRDRPAARPAPVHHPPRAGPRPLPRRRPRLLRLLPPERPRPRPPTPAARSQAGGRRGLAHPRDRAPEGRLVAAADRGASPARGGRRADGLPRDHLPARLRPGGPRGRPPPPPAQGPAAAREPPRPQAARRLHP